MHRQVKAYLVALLLLITVTWSVTFRWPDAPRQLGYLLLIGVYSLTLADLKLCPDGGSNWRRPLLLLLLPIVPMLVVIDPVEIGLVGHDPYHKMQNALVWGGPIPEFVDSELSFPLYFVFSQIVHQVVGGSFESLIKYLPLLAASVPVIYYLGLQRFLTDDEAYLAAVGTASIQTLLYFHTMFHEESFAITMFAMLFLFTGVAIAVRSSWLAWTPVIAIVLTHHLTAFLTIVFVVIWWGVRWSNLRIPSRLFAITSVDQLRGIPKPLAISVISISVVLFLLYPFAETVSRGIFLSLVEGTRAQSGSLAGATGQSLQQTIRSLGGRFATGIIVGTAALAVFSRHEISEWEFSWALFGGILAATYVVTLAVGQLINLDSIRLFFFMIITLLPVAVSYLYRPDSLTWKTATYCLVGLFIVAQIFALAPALVYSDTSQGYLHHGHYTESEHQAAETMLGVNDRKIVGYEPELWEVLAASDFQRLTDPQVYEGCENTIYVWKTGMDSELGIERSEIEQPYNKIYSAHTISLSECRDPPGLRTFGDG